MKTGKQNSFFRYAPLILALFIINGLVFLYYQNTVNKIGGTYVYPLDDTYIHLAVAKNAALHNNWGVTQHEFSSSSLSPIYTFLVAVFIKLFGDDAMYPLFINIFFGNLIILILYAFFNKKIWFLVCVLFLCTPVLLHIQILSGMEHTTHIFLILAAFMLFSRLTDCSFNNKKYCILFLVVTSLLCLTRYESMFFIAAVLFILLLNRQYTLLLLTFIARFLPVLLFGLWSISKGGFFFPNSLLLKGDLTAVGGRPILIIILHYGYKLYSKIFQSNIFIGPIIIIICIVIQCFINERSHYLNKIIGLIKEHSMVFITLVTIFFHTLFAEMGWLYRYEAYLFLLLYLTLVSLFYTNFSMAKNGIALMAFFMMLVFIFPAIVSRTYESNYVIKSGGKNINDQQVQMGKFHNTYYNDAMVMANDIGAITYYTNIKLKDLEGLGSNDITTKKIRKNFYISTVFSEYNEYNIIIIYDSWYGIKSKKDYENIGLIKIAELWIENNVICGGNPVSFYTSDEMMVEEMRANMVRFRDIVPKDVTNMVF